MELLSGIIGALAVEGPDAWEANETIRLIEIRDDVVVNPDILAFQGRAADFPHPRA